MAVYTQISAERLSAFLTGYDSGGLRSFKGIAEGVENSNYLIETARARYILTLYEKRVDARDLPFFMALLDHLTQQGCKVPRAIADRQGRQIQQLAGRPACLIEFLEGVSVSHPSRKQAFATGKALGEMHQALANFNLKRANSMGPASWHNLAEKCADDWDRIPDGAALGELVTRQLAEIGADWPDHLPHSVIHADLFPDNVLMLGDEVSGLIDFYFSCHEIRAYDLAVTHASWCFADHGRIFNREISDALIQGYASAHPLSDTERAALPLLARAAALRFTLSRSYDWINTPADALVTRKDPQDFARRLAFYAEPANDEIFHEQ